MNLRDYLRGVADKLTFHVPCYSHDDPEEEKIKEIIKLGESLRKKREKEEIKLMTFFSFFF